MRHRGLGGQMIVNSRGNTAVLKWSRTDVHNRTLLLNKILIRGDMIANLKMSKK